MGSAAIPGLCLNSSMYSEGVNRVIFLNWRLKLEMLLYPVLMQILNLVMLYH